MKKFLPLLILVCIACTKEEKEHFTIDQDNVSLQHDGTIQLTTTPSQTCTWTSDNETIATVSESGLVTGVFIGDTKIRAQTSTGNLIDVCNVHITPRSTLYTEPFFIYGSSISMIKSKEKRSLYNEDSESLIYNGENLNVRYVLYLFETTGLTSADVLLENTASVATETVTFLEERYSLLGFTDEVIMYQNSDGSIAAINVDDTLGLNVMYFKPTSERKKGCINLLDEFKTRIVKIKAQIP